MLQGLQQRIQNQQEQMNQQRGPLFKFFFTIGRILLISTLFRLVSRFVLPQLGVGENGAIMNTTPVIPPGVPVPTICAFSPHDRATLYVYTSYEPKFKRNHSTLIWKEEGITYDWASTNERDKNITVSVTPELLANKTMYAHIFLVKGNNQPSVRRLTRQIYTTYELTLFHPRPKVDNKKNLLSDKEETSDDNNNNVDNKKDVDVIVNGEEDNSTESNESAWIMYWKPALEVRLVADSHAMPLRSVPEPVKAKYQMDFNLGVYWPIFFVNTFWLKYNMLMPVNDTLAELPLTLHFSPMSMTKLTMFIQMENQFKLQSSLGGGIMEEEVDELKRIITETNPYYLGLTMIVSTVHSLFDILAFKNDISFWKSRKTVVGLSVKTLMMQATCGIIIFLYLLNEETSWMVIISSGVGTLIDLWKISKAAKLSFEWKTVIKSPKIVIPWIKISDRESYTKSKTKAYDEMAMHYLSFALYPLVIGYAIYSLIYNKHKSWYGWILESLTSAVYMFGFIMMTPQLFINYKLKSVAHLPWKALVYKSLGTFIDDMFAFIIKMPTMHRIACFRDDIVFFIYLYQRWKYPVDKNRIESLSWEDAEKDYEEQMEIKEEEERKKLEEENEEKREELKEDEGENEVVKEEEKKEEIKKKEVKKQPESKQKNVPKKQNNNKKVEQPTKKDKKKRKVD